MRSGAPAILLALCGCQWVIGPLNECKVDSDCAPKGPTLVCQNSLCVLPPPCAEIGSTDPNAIELGMICDLTDSNGHVDYNGPEWKEIVATILNDINPPTRAGIGGRGVRFVVCDATQNATTAGQLASQLIARGVPAILSDGSSETLNIAAQTVPANVLVMSGSAASPELTTFSASPNGVRLLWRTWPNGADAIPVAVSEIAGDAGTPPKVAVFERHDAYAGAIYPLFRDQYPGPEQPFLVEPGGGNVDQALTAVAAYQPDVKFTIIYPNEYIALLNAANDPAYASLLSSQWFFDHDGHFSALFANLTDPSRVEGARGYSPPAALWSSPAYAWLQEHVTQTYGFDPASPVNGVFIGDGAMLLILATAAAVQEGMPLNGTSLGTWLGRISDVDGGAMIPLDPPDLGTALSEFQAGREIDIEGASGHLDFDPSTGDAPNLVELWRIEDGGFVTLKVVTP